MNHIYHQYQDAKTKEMNNRMNSLPVVCSYWNSSYLMARLRHGFLLHSAPKTRNVINDQITWLHVNHLKTVLDTQSRSSKLMIRPALEKLSWYKLANSELARRDEVPNEILSNSAVQSDLSAIDEPQMERLYCTCFPPMQTKLTGSSAVADISFTACGRYFPFQPLNGQPHKLSPLSQSLRCFKWFRSSEDILFLKRSR